jgi:hypothetical protein
VLWLLACGGGLFLAFIVYVALRWWVDQVHDGTLSYWSDAGPDDSADAQWTLSWVLPIPLCIAAAVPLAWAAVTAVRSPGSRRVAIASGLGLAAVTTAAAVWAGPLTETVQRQRVEGPPKVLVAALEAAAEGPAEQHLVHLYDYSRVVSTTAPVDVVDVARLVPAGEGTWWCPRVRVGAPGADLRAASAAWFEAADGGWAIVAVTRRPLDDLRADNTDDGPRRVEVQVADRPTHVDPCGVG